MQFQSWKTNQWFQEKTPDIYLGFILIISFIVVGSGLKLFHKMLRKSETVDFKVTNLNKWLIFSILILLIAMLVGIIIFRIEAYYGVNPYHTSYAWKLNLFTSFTMIVMLGLWGYKGYITKMFIEWRNDIKKWYKKLVLFFSKKVIQAKDHKEAVKMFESITLSSPARGKLKKIELVKNDNFSKKIIGEGIVVVSENNIIYSPTDGVMETMIKTGHAYGIRTKNNVAILIHIGTDTLKWNGDEFKALVKVGQKVKKGQPIVKINFEKIKWKKKTMDIILLVLPESNVKIKLLRLSGSVTPKTKLIKTLPMNKELATTKIV